MKRNRFDVDEELVDKFNYKHLRRLFGYFSEYKGKMLFAFCLMIIYSVTVLIGPFFIKEAIDIVIPAKNFKGLLYISITFAGLVVIGAISFKYRIKILVNVSQQVLQKIRKDLFEHIQKLSFNYFDTRPHGKIIVRVVNYVNALNNLLSNGLIDTLTEIFSVFIIIGFMIYFSPKLTLICILGFPIVLVAIFLIKGKQRKAWQKVSRKQSNMNAYIHESINGIKVTQAYTQEEENFETLNVLNTEYKQAYLSAVKLSNLTWPIIDNISVLTVAIVYIVAIGMIAGGITVGLLVAFTSYAWRFWQPIINLGNSYNELVISIAYLERIFETLDEPVDIFDKIDAFEMPIIKGDVQFKDVVFGYDKEKIILNNINLTVKTGETIALVGPTGAGKTTVVNLLSRFYNLDSGIIEIDGVDIYNVKLESLRKQLGIMMQDTFLFSGTILENIKYGKLDATDEEVEKVSKIVHADDFIKVLKDGYNTQVEEKGARFSTGQRQLISFARTLLADPKILILDEATSSIDSETERLLQRGLNNLLKGRTSFVIAHRLSTIRNADRILYIDEGNILENGNHDQLIHKKGKYYNLYKQQYKFVE